MNNQKGFTLIELLVVVLIIGILAAMAMPQYFKAVERSRMTEAVTLLGNIAQAQQRKYMQINHFAGKFTGLDVAPKGASDGTYYTKGTATAPGNGFVVTLHSGSTYAGTTGGYAEAVRNNGANTTTGIQYPYTLKRFYADTKTQCTATGTGDAAANAKALCADFCGLDDLTGTSCCSDGTDGTCTNITDGNN